MNDIMAFWCSFPCLPIMDEGAAIRAVSPHKDVDCIHPLNVGLLSQGVSDFLAGHAWGDTAASAS